MEKEGKIPPQENSKPVFIIMEGKRYMAFTDGKGNAYFNKGTNTVEDYAEPSFDETNLINPCNYEFERFLTGFDF